MDLEIHDFIILDSQTLLAVGNLGALISIPKTAAIKRFRGSGYLNRTRAGDRAYGAGGFFTLENTGSWETSVTWQSYLQPPSNHDNASMEISRDGRFGMAGPRGLVYRLGQCWAAAQVPILAIEGGVGVFSHDSRKLHVLTSRGFLTTYDTDEFKVQSSRYLGIRADQAAFDSTGKSLLVAGSDKPEWVKLEQSTVRGGFVVDLYRYELPE